MSPVLVARILLVLVAITAVTAFESVGAILVVALLILPAATASLAARSVTVLVLASVAAGWVSATAGYAGAVAFDVSIAGSMGVAAAACFVVVLTWVTVHGRALARRRLRADAQLVA